MDNIDLKIISLLKKNARVSASAISKEVGLAVSSVTERIRRLENQGIILQYTTVIDNSKIEGGITAMIGLQALINMGVVTGVMPTTGLPLPFFSAGGTSVSLLMASTGIILSVSRSGRT